MSKAVFRYSRYTPLSKQWDHEHCEFCWDKFAVDSERKCLASGYVTLDGKHWVCESCFIDFRVALGFSVEENG